MCYQAVNSFVCGHSTPVGQVAACPYAQANGTYCPEFQTSVDEANSRYYDMPCMPCTGSGSGKKGKDGKSSSKKGKSGKR
jgi:hypothetical protein